jgi:hypothetical protein
VGGALAEPGAGADVDSVGEAVVGPGERDRLVPRGALGDAPGTTGAAADSVDGVASDGAVSAAVVDGCSMDVDVGRRARLSSALACVRK